MYKVSLLSLSPASYYHSNHILCRMHSHNIKLGVKQAARESSVHKETTDESYTGLQFIDQFGFHATTCCGFIPQDNTWEDDWIVSKISLN